MKRIILKTSELFDGYFYPEESWSLPDWVAKNEDFLMVLRDLITCNFEEYVHPKSFDELFAYLESKQYVIFQENFLVCLSQGRLVYLTHAGFSKVSATKELFEVSNWKIKA